MKDYTKKDVVERTEIDPRLIQFYVDSKVITPESHQGTRRGDPHRYSKKNLFEFALIKELRGYGMNLSSIRTVRGYLENLATLKKIPTQIGPTQFMVDVANSLEFEEFLSKKKRVYLILRVIRDFDAIKELFRPEESQVIPELLTFDTDDCKDSSIVSVGDMARDGLASVLILDLIEIYKRISVK